MVVMVVAAVAVIMAVTMAMGVHRLSFACKLRNIKHLIIH